MKLRKSQDQLEIVSPTRKLSARLPEVEITHSQKRPRFGTENLAFGSTNNFFASEFFSVNILEKVIYIRKADSWVNLSHLTSAGNLGCHILERLKKGSEYKYQVVRGHSTF